MHQLATITLALVVVGGIYMAAHIDHSGTLIPPTVVAVAAGMAMLAMFAIDVPIILAFSVARYQPVPDNSTHRRRRTV